MNILVIGGAGFIGSHVCKAIAARGDLPIVFDNLSRGNAHAVQWGPLFKGDVRDAAALDLVFGDYTPVAVMHFAANTEVEEGEQAPLAFWDNNVGGVIALLQAMRRAGCDRLVFSSTCATYGMIEQFPLTEDRLQLPVNVYGRTKLAVEHMLADVSRTEGLRYAALRYFNAAGASPDGEIGEEHKPETHLIPNALKAAAGLGGTMKVFGGDYDTPDGTCIRDYIHVMDLAAAHLAALDRLGRYKGGVACNVGTGQGHSVRDVLEAVEAVTGRPVPYELHDRRPGDPPRLVADVTLSRDLLGFQPVSSDLETIVRTAWNFHQARWQATVVSD
ncbi:MAG: UDP-glucose-4-epimerase GalE [Maricaulis maris]|jgi:UDP-glucose-4-epimerase GalE|uniref:UDP-glucose 4-epimerase n=1 Tax=Maricaulis maris (strain MCS10) TaxID=394221 RepID=Q0AKZ9_MARMM|nr:UDP-glucose 4-epimerase GalE [Maricaulis maris]ABI67044.1 UDP-galactose 4-epimerase [Maricaulis maris MCS10]